MSLILWLPLQGTLENKGISNVTVDGHSSTVDTTHGKLAAACQKFTRASTPTNFLSLPALLEANSQFTYTCWFNTASVAQNQCLFSQRKVADFTGFTIFYMGATTDANADTIRFDDGSGLFSTGKISTTGKWYHIACVRTATQKLIYINGELSGSGSINTPTNINANYITIGGSQNNAAGSQPSGNGLNGYLQDIRLYDEPLSAAEIKELSRGLMIHYKLDEGYGDHENLLKYTYQPSTSTRIRMPQHYNNGSVSGRGTYSTAEHGFRFTIGSSVKYAYWSFGATSDDAGSSLHGLQAGETYTFSGDCEWKVLSSETGMAYETASSIQIALRYSTTLTGSFALAKSLTISSIPQSSKGTVMSARCEFTFTVPTTAVKLYLSMRCTNGTASHYAAGDYIEVRNAKLEHSNIATPYTPSLFDLNLTQPTDYFVDSSGYDNYGTINGSITKILNKDARFSNIAYIDNNSNLIPTNLINTSEGAFSFSLWYNATEYIDSAMVMRIKLNDNLMFNFGCTGANDANSHQFIVFRSQANYIAYKNFTFPLNEWHMWTGTYDGTTVRLYRDGILLGSSTGTSNWSTSYSDGAVLLGNTSQVSLKAYASDIRIYATALDATVVKELYETALKIDNYSIVHPYEIIENNDTVLLQKNGQLLASEITEITIPIINASTGEIVPVCKATATDWYATEYIER